jgi:hypothetical protein
MQTRCGIGPRSLHFHVGPKAQADDYEWWFRMTRTSRVAQRFTAAILALMVSSAAVACGGTDSDRSLGPNSGDEEPLEEAGGDGGDGAPFQGGEGDGAGAPFKIPAIAQVGAPYPEVKDSIEQTFLDACGTPQLCVDLAVEDRTNGGEPCDFVTTDPAGGTEIERGSTVTLVVVAPCPGGSPVSDEGSGDETQDDETQDDETQDDETQDDETQDDETQDDETQEEGSQG